MNTIDLGELLTPNRIRIRQNVASKKKALELIAELFCQDITPLDDADELSHSQLLDAFVAREKIGSTALEHGIAVPHCRVKQCTEPMIAVISLAQAIEFGSSNNDIDIDLICGLIVPAEECQQHLDILAALVKILGVEDNRQIIRSASSVDEVYNVMSQPQQC